MFVQINAVLASLLVHWSIHHTVVPLYSFVFYSSSESGISKIQRKICSQKLRWVWSLQLVDGPVVVVVFLFFIPRCVIVLLQGDVGCNKMSFSVSGFHGPECTLLSPECGGVFGVSSSSTTTNDPADVDTESVPGIVVVDPPIIGTNGRSIVVFDCTRRGSRCDRACTAHTVPSRNVTDVRHSALTTCHGDSYRSAMALGPHNRTSRTRLVAALPCSTRP